ncbi:T9SS type A sorting domain-containing protein [Chryseobacterium sp. LC2016-29]|uniref:type IX secretion system anionic LPS delivery protein PorZ n=1 Tax=Chryseobacterium sp. LC2016-29 TaxID=2897331 RepID=UPI001E334F34|nr:T9SS type A sorting domain-containing protein [Chryseobacterium sp. LC2016-29]MCD0480096.1 T9SS type A sorting domain-containing protein [Chryseobacterium sp. LC2016-29]
MKKISLLSFGIFASLQFVNAQNISSKKWADLFSYNNVLAMKEDNGKIVAATENGIFYYTISTGEITKLSKANGLHDVKISAFDYNPQTKIGLVGYQNGALDIITPQGVTYVVDIPIATGYNGSKKINHISITGDKAVVSVGYGVSIFDLKKKEFADSAFFINGGVFQASNEATILGNKVFAATNTGLKTHEMNTTFPVFTTWATEMPGNFTNIDSESVLAFSSATATYIYNNGISTPLTQAFGGINDVVVNSNNIIITDGSRIYTYNTNGNFGGTTSVGESCNTATTIGSKVYGGTKLSGVKTDDNIAYKPDGPYFNDSYKIRLFNDNQLLVSTGIRANGYNEPQINPKNPGFYYFTGTEWIYSSYFVGSPTVFNIIDAFPDPANSGEIFFSNYNFNPGYGIYKMKYNSSSKDLEFVKRYDLAAENQFVRRPVGFTSDDQNNIFATIGYSGPTAALAHYDRATDNFLLKDLNVSAGIQYPVFSNDLLWIPIPRTVNFLVYDTKKTASLSDDTQYYLDQSNGFPANTISFAMDKSGDAWVGTEGGLRVLPNAAAEIKNDPKFEPIVIEQGGLAEELFRDATILHIEVDGGNQKWVSVEEGGVYYLSASGEQTIKHFTKDNSPLPTNTVTDIKIDKKTGKVYFVTFDGIVTYQGDVADVTKDFGNVLVYPNPVVYSQFKGNVTIKGLAEKTNIRITDAAGNLVHSAIARTGYYEWNLNNQKGKRVASGIYFVLMTNEDGSDKATAKIAVVN